MTSDIGNVVTATGSKVFKLIDEHWVFGLGGIRVFDVGQGDCIGLRDQDNEVFCYVDYGGLGDHPDRGNPSHTSQRMTVQHRGGPVAIVLTHWDKDHYWSARKKNVDAQDCPWLVPRQKVSPQAVLFARNLTNARCWPESEGRRARRFPVGVHHAIAIRKCGTFDEHAVAEDRNRTGLVVSLHNRNRVGSDSMMLLPGDCAFDVIPALPAHSISALVAYHHGSDTDWTTRTGPAIANASRGHRMVYSFGNNGYGHPNRANYRNCQPDWDCVATTTQDVRRNGKEFEDVGW
jgi:hypothetical protein